MCHNYIPQCNIGSVLRDDKRFLNGFPEAILNWFLFHPVIKERERERKMRESFPTETDEE